MNNFKDLLKLIAVVGATSILIYYIAGPEETGAIIKIRVVNDNNTELKYSSDDTNWHTIQNGTMQFPIHNQTISISNHNVTELSFTETPHKCFLSTIDIVIDNTGTNDCDTNNKMRLNGTVTSNQSAVLTVKDLNDPQPSNPSDINNNNYSGCYFGTEIANTEFYWPNKGTVGLKVKKKNKNSNTAINITLTDVDPGKLLHPSPIGQPDSTTNIVNPNQ